MGRVIFDMNSTDTFNALEWKWMFQSPQLKREIVWPSWLTLPVHYQDKKPIWSQVIEIISEGRYPQGNITVVKLSCGHVAHCSTLYVRNAMEHRKHNLFISCMECGGNGAAEVRG